MGRREVMSTRRYATDPGTGADFRIAPRGTPCEACSLYEHSATTKVANPPVFEFPAGNYHADCADAEEAEILKVYGDTILLR
jgi:hypothetical protein